MRADRLITLIMRLQTRGKVTAQTLAAELGVSRRTILRDVEALSASGIPIYAEGGHGGGIGLDENYRTTLTGLKEAELRTLFIAANTQLLDDIGLGGAAESTQLKLQAALPARHQSIVEQVRQRLYIDPVWWWHDTQPQRFWKELQQAVFEDRRIRVTYEYYSGEMVERVLEPYSLVAKASHWYLIGRREAEFRLYRVSRFHQITLMGQTFQRQADFDLTTYWQEHLQEFTETLAEYPFTLRLHTSRLNFVTWLVPGRCQIVEPPDANGWLMLHIRIESAELAQMLVFGLGKQAQVVEPAELRQAVIELAREILENATGSG